jgi:hypothetical protein
MKTSTLGMFLTSSLAWVIAYPTIGWWLNLLFWVLCAIYTITD